MKYIDKFLKWLGTDRNTFACYVFTLLTVYIFVDRMVEMLMMFFTGISLSYWGPITYTLALACPVLAFLFSGTSQLIKSNKMKTKILNQIVKSPFYLLNTEDRTLCQPS